MIPRNQAEFRIPGSAKERKGFSLVEVTMALGILSFAIVGLLGLMPVGLQTMRDAIDDSTTSLIARRFIGEYRQNSLDAILAQPISQRSFDFEGQEVAKDSDPMAIYKAKATATLTSGTTSSSGNLASSPNLVKVEIIISALNSSSPGRSYVAYVARN